MKYAIINIFIIIAASVGSMFFTGAFSVLIMLSGLMMVIVTYAILEDDQFEGEENIETGGEVKLHRNSFSVITAVKFVAACAFAVVSGGFPGFAVFAVFDEWKWAVNGLIATVLFVVSSAVRTNSSFDSRDIAILVVESLALMAIVMILSLAKLLVRNLEIKKEADRARVLNSNVSEMHEKRLNRELVKQNYLADKNARLLERENISRNIHNSVGHSITAAIMTLDAADMLYDVKPDEARKRMNDANERIRGSLESIRRAVRTLDDAEGAMPISDLKAAVEGIVDDFIMDTERRVDVIYDLPEDAETGGKNKELQIEKQHVEFLTGVLEELLTNGVKHGNATKFIVILTGDSAHIRLEVKDDGKSDFTDDNSKARIDKGFGVKKIISYAERCGGKTSFVNEEDGFRATVELPILL